MFDMVLEKPLQQVSFISGCRSIARFESVYTNKNACEEVSLYNLKSSLSKYPQNRFAVLLLLLRFLKIKEYFDFINVIPVGKLLANTY